MNKYALFLNIPVLFGTECYILYVHRPSVPHLVGLNRWFNWTLNVQICLHGNLKVTDKVDLISLHIEPRCHTQLPSRSIYFDGLEGVPRKSRFLRFLNISIITIHSNICIKMKHLCPEKSSRWNFHWAQFKCPRLQLENNRAAKFRLIYHSSVHSSSTCHKSIAFLSTIVQHNFTTTWSADDAIGTSPFSIGGQADTSFAILYRMIDQAWVRGKRFCHLIEW